MREILLQHFAAHPAMQPQDAVKLLYQSVFGGGHLIADEAKALARLGAELEATPERRDCPYCERIGGGRVRLELASPVTRAVPAELICDLFVRSSRDSGTMPEFLQSLSVLRALTDEGRAPFDSAALEAYLGSYEAAGCPLVSHTATYHDAYAPAYRVLSEKEARLIPILARLSALPAAEEAVVVCIDGRCASGKTTLAATLAELTGAGLIHMDDFFLPPEKRTPSRLSEPGGNVDYERFVQEVLPQLRSGAAFSYRRFDCSRMAPGDVRQIPAGSLRIVEGSYSAHPAFGAYADLRVFSDVEPQEQLRRLSQRESPEQLEQFRTRWIPMEERYFDALRIREAAEVVV